MSERRMSERWPAHSTDDEVATAEFIHARSTSWDDETICERGTGRLLPFGSVTLDLSDARAKTVERPVDCPECLSWLHA